MIFIVVRLNAYIHIPKDFFPKDSTKQPSVKVQVNTHTTWLSIESRNYIRITRFSIDLLNYLTIRFLIDLTKLSHTGFSQEIADLLHQFSIDRANYIFHNQIFKVLANSEHNPPMVCSSHKIFNGSCKPEKMKINVRTL